MMAWMVCTQCCRDSVVVGVVDDEEEEEEDYGIGHGHGHDNNGHMYA